MFLGNRNQEHQTWRNSRKKNVIKDKLTAIEPTMYTDIYPFSITVTAQKYIAQETTAFEKAELESAMKMGSSTATIHSVKDIVK